MLFSLSTLYPHSACKTPDLIPLKASDADGILPNYELAFLINVMASKSRLAWVGDMTTHYTLKQESWPDRYRNARDTSICGTCSFTETGPLLPFGGGSDVSVLHLEDAATARGES